MNRPSNIIIQRVLDESATLAEAKQVAAWFASQDGQKWLADQMERDIYSTGRFVRDFVN